MPELLNASILLVTALVLAILTVYIAGVHHVTPHYVTPERLTATVTTPPPSQDIPAPETAPVTVSPPEYSFLPEPEPIQDPSTLQWLSDERAELIEVNAELEQELERSRRLHARALTAAAVPRARLKHLVRDVLVSRRRPVLAELVEEMITVGNREVPLVPPSMVKDL